MPGGPRSAPAAAPMVAPRVRLRGFVQSLPKALVAGTRSAALSTAANIEFALRVVMCFASWGGNSARTVPGWRWRKYLKLNEICSEVPFCIVFCTRDGQARAPVLHRDKLDHRVPTRCECR